MIDYRVLQRLAWLGLAVAVALIVVVQFAGIVVKGSQRWLDLGVRPVQPSELAKLAVILALARFAARRDAGRAGARRRRRSRSSRSPCRSCLVGLQPDLGSAILLGSSSARSAFLMPCAACGRWSGGIGAALSALPLLWDHMHELPAERILAFLDPSADPTGAGWHTQQSIFAVGSGHLTGKGFMHGTQNQFNFLPEHWTDFPFSVWAEEWGFLGSPAAHRSICS